jgi:hypothetical protein
MQAEKVLKPTRNAVSSVWRREAHRELVASEHHTHSARALRGLAFAVLLALPFWVATYLLLRWWAS